MSIRLARETDLPQILAIYAPYVSDTLYSLEYTVPDSEEFTHRFRDITVQFPWLVWEENGKILGYAYGSLPFHRVGYSWSGEVSIYLHPDAQKGCGVGSALYEKLLALLTDQGYCTALGVLYGGNEESLRLHQKFGFEDVLLLPNAAYKHGQWLDMRIMKKTLRPYDERPSLPIPFCEYRKRL